jgi:hypothetical protein
MASLYITFGQHISTAGAPIMDGSKSRQFAITIGGATVSTFAAVAGENVVRLVAGAACYVDVGAVPLTVAPNSTTAVRGFMLPNGGTIELAVESGEKVAVLAI